MGPTSKHFAFKISSFQYCPHVFLIILTHSCIQTMRLMSVYSHFGASSACIIVLPNEIFCYKHVHLWLSVFILLRISRKNEKTHVKDIWQGKSFFMLGIMIAGNYEFLESFFLRITKFYLVDNLESSKKFSRNQRVMCIFIDYFNYLPHYII